MRRLVPAGGRRPALVMRTLLMAFALGAALGACATAPLPSGEPPRAEAGADLLVPQGFIAGGFTAPVTRPPGFGPMQGARGEFVKFVFPSALAATGLDLFVVDSGLRALLRVDTATQAVARVAPLPGLPGVRVAAGPDGSAYLLRPDRAEITRFSREGRPLGSFASSFEILRPSDVVVERGLNRVWIADAAGGVFAFHSSGRMSQPLVGRGDGFALPDEGATLLAAGPRGVVGVDKRCACLLVFDPDGQVVARIGEGVLLNPVALAVDDYGRSWVLDGADQQLKIFEDDTLAFATSAGRLGLADLTAIAIHRQRVFLADGPGGKIGVFALLPPRRAP